VARFRRMLAPINSNKHYVHQPRITVTSGTLADIVPVDTVVAPAAAQSNQVEEGSVVKAIYMELWFQSVGLTGTTNTFTAAIEKLPGNTPIMTFAQSLNLGAYPNKKNILYVTQGITGSVSDGSPMMPIYKGWIKIPKGKQRMGLDDRIVLNISASVQDAQVCGIFTYKEYR